MQLQGPQHHEHFSIHPGEAVSKVNYSLMQDSMSREKVTSALRHAALAKSGRNDYPMHSRADSAFRTGTRWA
jgi:hypothetical protein